MANVFSNPLVLAETIVGSVIDQRSVVLYKQQDFMDVKSELENELLSATQDTSLFLTVQDFVRKRELKELYTGTEIPYVSEINGFNMWGVSYMDANVSISSNICDHPIENGAVISDSTIRNPITAEVSIVMPTAFYTTIYQQIEKDYKEKNKIMLLTKFGLIQNMIISAMPYKLEHGTVDRPTINLTLREIMEVTPEYIASAGGEREVEITPTNALSSDDTDMQVIGQKRYITTLTDSLDV